MALVQATHFDTALDAAQGTSIAKAAATITHVTAEPAEDDVIIVNGVTFTWKTAPSGTNEIAHGASIDDSITNLAAALQASTDPAVNQATYTADLGNDRVDVEYKIAGAIGNAFTLEATYATTANVSIAGATTEAGDGTETTLTGGAETGATAYMSEDVAKASATITHATDEPIEGDTLVVNGATFTFKATPVSQYDINIETSLAAQAATTAAALEASTDPRVVLASYSAAGAVVTVLYNEPGTVGNAFTLSATLDTTAWISIAGAATVTGTGAQTTLDGGSDTIGLLSQGRLDDTFEANVATVIAMAEFVLANTVDPTSDPSEARRQRHLMKETMNRFASKIAVQVDENSDDRVADAFQAAKAALRRFNGRIRPDDTGGV